MPVRCWLPCEACVSSIIPPNLPSGIRTNSRDMKACPFPRNSHPGGAGHEAAVTLLAASVLPTEQVQSSLHGEVRPLPRRRLPSARGGWLLAWSPRARAREAALGPESPEASPPRGCAGARITPSPGHALEPPPMPYPSRPCQRRAASKGGTIWERT